MWGRVISGSLRSKLHAGAGSCSDVIRASDILPLLLMDRSIFINGKITEVTGSSVIRQLLYLESHCKSKKPITVYINSPGGDIYTGLGIYDSMQRMSCSITTICVGQASCMASLLLVAGTHGKRCAFRHSRIMGHQPSNSIVGSVSQSKIKIKETITLRETLNKLFCKHTGKPLELIEKYMDQDTYMSVNEAKKFGIIDKVLKKRCQNFGIIDKVLVPEDA